MNTQVSRHKAQVMATKGATPTDTEIMELGLAPEPKPETPNDGPVTIDWAALTIEDMVAADAPDFVVARFAVVRGDKAQYGRYATYANSLTAKFGYGWWMIPMVGKVDDNHVQTRKDIKAEKSTFHELYKSELGPKSNPSAAWTRVLEHAGKDTGREEKVAKPHLDVAKEKGSALYRRLYKHWDEIGDTGQDACDKLGEFLKVLGVDLAKFDE